MTHGEAGVVGPGQSPSKRFRSLHVGDMCLSWIDILILVHGRRFCAGYARCYLYTSSIQTSFHPTLILSLFHRAPHHGARAQTRRRGDRLGARRPAISDSLRCSSHFRSCIPGRSFHNRYTILTYSTASHVVCLLSTKPQQLD